MLIESFRIMLFGLFVDIIYLKNCCQWLLINIVNSKSTTDCTLESKHQDIICLEGGIQGRSIVDIRTDFQRVVEWDIKEQLNVFVLLDKKVRNMGLFPEREMRI